MSEVVETTGARPSPSKRATLARSLFVERCRTVDERNRIVATDCDAVFEAYGDAPLRTRLCGLDVGGVRVTAVRDEGGARMRAAWHDDAFGAVFLWGERAHVDGVPHRAPRLVIAGPGTEVTTAQMGSCRSLRIGVRGDALAALRADAIAAPCVEPWLGRGIFRPPSGAAREWRLQEKIIRATAFVERAVAQSADVATALPLIADEVTGQLLELLDDVRAQGSHRRAVSPARRRLVRAALDLLEAAEDEPASVAATCRRLGVGERTLQRAFEECVGSGLRAYERERRLRRVHGAILAQGDRRTVTDIAMSFGFWHLGRFAGAYRALYGCSPAATRKRVWGGAPEWRHPPPMSAPVSRPSASP